MANKNLFSSIIGRFAPKADTVNEAGGKAYSFTPEGALAQYGATGCLSGTYYATDVDQLDHIMTLAGQVDSEFIARTAIYSRERGFMKDTPALLCAILTRRNPALLESIFPRVIDNGRMLRTFVQIMRSGVIGRKSLGTAPKRMIVDWIARRSDEALFRDSVGNTPSMADIIRMVHPRPGGRQREALFGWMIGRPYDRTALPPLVEAWESFKRGESTKVPDVPFQMLTAVDLSAETWLTIARNASWQTTRMNLNTFERHGVFNDAATTEMIAARLRDREAIRKARVFPYQLLSAYKAAGATVPRAITEALQDAMEIAIENVPQIEGKVFVLPDVSGSMLSPVTGHRAGATTAVRCIDVAALVAAAVLRRNPTAEILPFAESVKALALNPRDSVMTNAARLTAIGGGGTNCSAPLKKLNRSKATGDLVILVSDNESWADPQRGRGTETMKEWNAFKVKNPQARLVCIDLQPYSTTQAAERDDVLNVGGFSDAVFDLVAELAAGRSSAGEWERTINAIALERSAVA
jgi:60 kDa SS-A/Ro ribonucleoprotein